MKPLIVGMCAHVDAGKTTLSEALLYQSGKIKVKGRVDHGDTVLDCTLLERQRGITITAKEAFFTWGDRDITLLDTPGHRDFSAALEQTLAVLDAAILIISATEHNYAESERLLRHLADEQIPTIIFVNKMDIAPLSRREVRNAIRRFGGTSCLDFQQPKKELNEELALCSDELWEEYWEKGTIAQAHIAAAVSRREVIPVLFGSALKQEGMRELLDTLIAVLVPRAYDHAFAARVYRISHDEMGQRWTHMKITGGKIAVKQGIGTEKIDQIRRYHGNTYETCTELAAGYVAAVKGLHQVEVGAVLGEDVAYSPALMSTALVYRIVSSDLDGLTLFNRLRSLMDEDPSLRIHYDPHWHEVQLSLRGSVQQEVLTQLILDRFQLQVTFTPARIAYRESILAPIEGVGHIERLRHYAEVHVRLEPLSHNGEVEIIAACPAAMLAEARQQQLVAYLSDHLPPGVICAAPLGDLRITIIAVKTHPKHTDAQDLADAAKRAIRQGLKMGSCVLLEPMVKYQLYCPQTALGQVIYDLQQREASYEITAEDERQAVVCGGGPLRTLSHYEIDLLAYTQGQGSLEMNDDGYRQREDALSIDGESGDDEAINREYPWDSYTLDHGIIKTIPYDQVYAHLDIPLQKTPSPAFVSHTPHRQTTISEAELARVTQRLHQPRKQWKPRQSGGKAETPQASLKKPPCLIVDGYNMIYAWPKLKDLVKTAPDAARDQLLTMLSNYQGYWHHPVIVVFDAYRTSSPQERIVHDQQLEIVYTKSAQTADAYIEKATHHLAGELTIIVATSDGAEQNIILGQGALRISARELYERIQTTHQQAMNRQNQQPSFRHMALEELRQYNEEEKDVDD